MTGQESLQQSQISRKGLGRYSGLGIGAFALAFLTAAVAAGSETVLLSGDLGYDPQIVQSLPEGAFVDAKSAVFHVANSGNLNPSEEFHCESGELAVNRYPLQIRNSPQVTLQGGLFAGEVPLVADWQDTYCNSTAVGLRTSPGAVIEGIRMRRVWDALRISEDSGSYLLRGGWISEVRDDCIENDYLNAGVIEDMLLDGCFSGLSMRPPKGEDRDPDSGVVVLRDVLMRMQSYLYKGELREGPPFKVEETGPKIAIHDSIVVMGNVHNVSKQRLAIGWSRIGACSGNLLLWTADTPWPDDFEKPPSCFQLVEGPAARTIWQEARQNWINCHPDIMHFSDDPVAAIADCTPGVFGARLMHNR